MVEKKEWWADIVCPLSYQDEPDKIKAITEVLEKHGGRIVEVCRYQFACHIMGIVNKHPNYGEKDLLEQDLVQSMISLGRTYKGLLGCKNYGDNRFEWVDSRSMWTVSYTWRQPTWFKTTEEKAAAKIRKKTKLDIVGRVFINDSRNAIFIVREDRGWYTTVETYGPWKDSPSNLTQGRYPKKDVMEWLEKGTWKKRDLPFLLQKGEPDVCLTEALMREISPMLYALSVVAPGLVQLNGRGNWKDPSEWTNKNDGTK
jgi:hypothetical protein